MRRLFLRIVALMSAFGLGVGLNQVISGGEGPQTPRSQPVMVVITETHEDATTTTEADAELETIVTASPQVIFDFNSENFLPENAYFILEPKPKNFLEFDHIDLALVEVADGRRSGYVSVQTMTNDKYDHQTALFGLVTERRVFFVIPDSEGGFEYRFDGEFLVRNLKAARKNKAVLRGTLTKTEKGRKVAVRVVSFRLEYHRC